MTTVQASGRKAFAHAFGAYHLATVFAGTIPGGATDEARRAQDEAGEALIAARATTPAELAFKLDLVWGHTSDDPEAYVSVAEHLGDCLAETVKPKADLGGVGHLLVSLAADLEAAGAPRFHRELLRSAAVDAARLAGLEIAH